MDRLPILRRLWLLALFAYWSACLSPGQAVALESPGQNPNPSPAPESLLSNHGLYRVQYVSVPAPIPLNQMFELRIAVRERYKRSLAKRISLNVDAGMRAHNHGMNTRSVVERLPDGSFRVRGMLFHMPGEWHLTFSIKRGLVSDLAETDVVIQ